MMVRRGSLEDHSWITVGLQMDHKWITNGSLWIISLGKLMSIGL